MANSPDAITRKELAQDDIPTGIEVLIGEEWFPVLRSHFSYYFTPGGGWKHVSKKNTLRRKPNPDQPELPGLEEN